MFVKLNPLATIPMRGSPDAAGLDLYSIEDKIINPWTLEVIQTGLGAVIPKGFVGKIESRSGLSLIGMTVRGGIIDADYRGEIKVMLRNETDAPYKLGRGDRIAQLLIIPVAMIEPEEMTMEEFEKSKTMRGNKGFGSTG